MSKFYTVSQVAAQLGCLRNVIDEHIRHGRIRAVNISAGLTRPTWRIPEDAVESFINSRTATPAPPAKPARRRRQTSQATQYF